VAAVAVVISDSGKGIPPEILRNIFSPFFTTKATGTGLGLPIVHRIITNHLGRIDVSSGPSGGAVFTVILPVQS
jgi:two-component system, NtrC family, sensor histidine kinase HydH